MNVSSASMEVSLKRVMTPDPEVEPSPQKRPRVAEYRRRHVKYQRHSKPPYTYLGMTVVAIQSAPNKCLTLGGIHSALAEMFPFFQGEYRGWRDSVRHNLSFNACFVKTSNKSKGKNSSGCFWTVDLSLVPADGFRRAKVSKDMESKWAHSLTEQLQIPSIILPPPRTPPAKVLKRRSAVALEDAANSTSTLGSLHQKKTENQSLSYIEAQYTRYLREQTPEQASVPLSQYPPFASLLYESATSSVYAAAADNLHYLCRPSQYGTPIQEARSTGMLQATPLIQLPAFNYSGNGRRTSATSTRVRDTPSPEIVPSIDDPFSHLLSSWNTVPESLLNLSLDLEQTTSGSHQRRERRLQTTSALTDVKPRNRITPITERIPSFVNPYFNNSFTSDSSHDVDATTRFCDFLTPPMTSESITTFVPPAPPSECSTISYVSENSQMSTSGSHCLFPFTDFSTVSFQDHSSLSDIFS